MDCSTYVASAWMDASVGHTMELMVLCLYVPYGYLTMARLTIRAEHIIHYQDEVCCPLLTGRGSHAMC